MRAAILVLGDLGRSPRMQYHALAMAAAGADVDLIGLSGADPFPAIRRNGRITCHFISPAAAPPLFRAVWDGVRALWTLLFVVPAPDVILVQDPPAIPTLPAGWIAARLRGARFIVDWHNFAYSMLALRFPARRRLTAAAKWLERALGRRADGHLCVSRAMQAALKSQWGIDAVPLHDRPVEELFAAHEDSTHDARGRLSQILGIAIPAETVVVISPTSWSLDEDFDLFVEAIRLSNAYPHEGEAPHAQGLLLVLTGLGPRRAEYERRLAGASMDRVRVATTWLDAGEYHDLLGAADAGLCLHRSASGLDLPMKIADMFGAGLPVIALDYGPVLKEILQDGQNGRLFSDSAGLARILDELSVMSPPVRAELARLSDGAKAAAATTWEIDWNARARRVVLR